MKCMCIIFIIIKIHQAGQIEHLNGLVLAPGLHV